MGAVEGPVARVLALQQGVRVDARPLQQPDMDVEDDRVQTSEEDTLEDVQ